MSRSICLAKIGAAHGVKGDVRVKSFTSDPLALTTYQPLTTDTGAILEIERARVGKDVLVVKFRGIDGRNAAEALNGVSLYVDREALPEPDADEFLHADLIGLTAYDDAGERLGTVVAVHDFGAGDILAVAPPRGTSILIPFTKEAVPEVDIAGGRVVIVPPPDADEENDE